MRAVRGRLSTLCGRTWCYMGWAGHEGYVHSNYLAHHVTVVVASLVHEVHVHEHHVHHHRQLSWRAIRGGTPQMSRTCLREKYLVAQVPTAFSRQPPPVRKSD